VPQRARHTFCHAEFCTTVDVPPTGRGGFLPRTTGVRPTCNPPGRRMGTPVGHRTVAMRYSDTEPVWWRRRRVAGWSHSRRSGKKPAPTGGWHIYRGAELSMTKAQWHSNGAARQPDQCRYRVPNIRSAMLRHRARTRLGHVLTMLVRSLTNRISRHGRMVPATVTPSARTSV